jgi:hypothetical protein
MLAEHVRKARPWPVRRAFPLIAVVVMICIGMAGTIWGPAYYGQKTWAVPDDLWATLVAAQRLLHLDLAGLYTAPTNLVSFPGTAVILVPVAAIMDAAGLPIHAGRQGVHPAGWLVAGPLETLIAGITLFAADALAERLGVNMFKRFVLAGAGATALWNVSIRWGHPEDAVAVGLLLYAVLALANDRPSRAAWLAGCAVAVQPLALLAFPLLAIAAVPIRRLPGFLAQAATPALALLAAAAAANWTATIHAVTNQPNAPNIDHPTPWIYVSFLAPPMSGGSVAAGPARALAVLVACACAAVTWRRWQTARRAGVWCPDDLAGLLWWIAVTLALRTVFEPVMVSYYVWPPLAVALVAASRDWIRLIPASVTAIVLTFLAQGSWRNPWVWWTPVVVVLALTLAAARPARSPAPRVLPETGEQFVAGSTLPKARRAEERPGDDAVPGLVRVLVRAARWARALPGPLADEGDVARDRADPRHRHPVAEVRGLEGAEHVRHARARLRVRLAEQVVVPGGQPLTDPGDGLAGEAVEPFGQRGQVVGHPDDADARARRGVQPGQDRVQIADRVRDICPDAAGDRVQADTAAAAVLGIVGADVDGDQVYVAAMSVQEGGRRGQLGAAAIPADAAADHGGGRLARAAELHQLQRGLAAAQHRVQLIGIALPGLDAGSRRVRLDSLGQRIAQGQVVSGRDRV